MIFISYSSVDDDAAHEVKRSLERNHFKCFLSGDDVETDDDWFQGIWSALYGCDAFLGLVTPHFVQSAFCQQEVGAALALKKPRLLVLNGTPAPPGFASRFQACKSTKLQSTLSQNPRFRKARVAAWIEGAKSVNTYKEANALHDRFVGEWAEMDEGEKLKWLSTAAANGQMREEGFKVGPFFKRAKRELKSAMTNQWLLENDADGRFHDPEKNPLSAKQKESPAKRPKK